MKMSKQLQSLFLVVIQVNFCGGFAPVGRYFTVGASASFVSGRCQLHIGHNQKRSLFQDHYVKLPLRSKSSSLQSSAAATSSSSSPVINNYDDDGPTVGDTRGASLLLTSLSVSRGPNPILADVNLRVEPGSRWGITGPNGCGKSTLLGAITGKARIDEGAALVGSKVRLGYLRQTAVSGSDRTVAEEAASEMDTINEARLAMDRAQKRVEEGDTSDGALKALDRTTERFNAVGGLTQEQEVETTLRGLGFLPGDSRRKCSDFSGGWQMRIALARTLLSHPSLLLLDEPSNHLDSAARDWLGTYLGSYDGSLVVVSHDVRLLDKAVNNIAEVRGNTLVTYPGCTYSSYLTERDNRARAAQAEYERNMAEAEKLQSFVDRFGASATKASSAQSRVKALERMRKQGKLDPPPVAATSTIFRPELTLPDPPKSIGEDLIALSRASMGYDPDVPPLLEGIDLTLRRGMKLILRGPNGAGKSTLLAALRGTLPLRDGRREVNERLRLGVFTQDLAQELDTSVTALSLVTSHARSGPHGDVTLSDQDARAVMGRLGLGGDKPLRLVGDLSGGEKARVALSMFALKASNVLILDEPSNHLDVECIKALSEALSDWGENDGAVVVVSHDRAFCEEVGFTHVGTVQNGCLTLEQRNLDERDWAQYDIMATGVASPSVGSSLSNGSINSNVELTTEEKEQRKLRRKQAFNAPKRIAKLEKLIEKAELKMAELDEEMMKNGSDVGKLMELNEKKEKEEAAVAKHMEEWEELEVLLAELG